MPSIFRTIAATFVGLVGSVALASGALAQPTDLAIDADEDWEHEWTDMTFPARIGDFERESVSQFEDRQTNISGGFRDTETIRLCRFMSIDPAIQTRRSGLTGH